MKKCDMNDFDKKVYRAIMTIPIGEVRTYKWVAEKIKHPRAYRAVGQSLKKNPYLVIIPCHRVVASDGELGGYAGGVRRKKYLLELERQIREMVL